MKTRKRALRADAERNRRHILEVAEETFGTEGLSVPIDEIAARAGLGVGTLYRHFPTKEALFEAIVLDRMERLAEHAEACAGMEDAGKAFFEFLERLVTEGERKRDFVDALGEDFTRRAPVLSAKKGFRESLEALLGAAQRAKAVREDVEVADLLALVRGLFASTSDKKSRARQLAILCDGLRPRIR